jgi:hypothetical protein
MRRHAWRLAATKGFAEAPDLVATSFQLVRNGDTASSKTRRHGGGRHGTLRKLAATKGFAEAMDLVATSFQLVRNGDTAS